MASAEPKLTEKGKEGTSPSSSPKESPLPASPSGGEGKPTLKLTQRLMLIRNKDFKGGMKDGDAIKRKEIRYLIE